MRVSALGQRLAAQLAKDFAGSLISKLESEHSDVDRCLRDVVDAVTLLQQAKHTSGEPAAYRALERRALALRTVVRKQDERS